MNAAASTLLSAMLLGSMIFFAAVVAPTVFKALPAEAASRYLRTVFPRYYLSGAVLAGAATITALPASPVAAAILATVALAFVAVRQGLIPAINAARDAGTAGDNDAAGRFRQLHRLSVVVNLLQMILVLLAFILLQSG